MIEAEPGSVDALMALGDAWAAVWNHREAIAVYDRVLAGQHESARALAARVTPDLPIEGSSRLYFNRLRFYQGQLREADLPRENLSDIEVTTLAYGVGVFKLVEGDRAGARAQFERAVSTSAWPALAFIAAEEPFSVVVSRPAIVVRIERQGRGARRPHLGHDVRQAQVTQDAPDHRAILNQRHQLQPARTARACQHIEAKTALHQLGPGAVGKTPRYANTPWYRIRLTRGRGVKRPHPLVPYRRRRGLRSEA